MSTPFSELAIRPASPGNTAAQSGTPAPRGAPPSAAPAKLLAADAASGGGSHPDAVPAKPELPRLASLAETFTQTQDYLRPQDERTVPTLRQIDQLISKSHRLLESGLHPGTALEPLGKAIRLANSIFLPEDENILRSGGALLPSAAGTPARRNIEFLVEAEAKIIEKQKRGLDCTPFEKAVVRNLVWGSTLENILDAGFGWRALLSKAELFYDANKNGEYPLRNARGEPLYVVGINPKSTDSWSGRSYSNDAVKPFLKRKDMTHAQRASLYDGLSCVPFEKRHCRPGRSSEEGIIGRTTVVANRPYKAGECLGVYGGDMAHVSTEIARFMPRSFLLDVHSGKPNDDSRTSTGEQQRGDNILAHMLTLFDEKNGAPCAQAKDGYSVDVAQFKVKTEDNLYRFITALFALTDIEPEQAPDKKDLRPCADLRWCYGYKAEGVAEMLKREAEDLASIAA